MRLRVSDNWVQFPVRSIVMLLIAALCCSSSASAEDFEVELPEIIDVKVHQVMWEGHSTLAQMRGLISVKLTVKNLTDSQIDLQLSEFKGTCGNQKEIGVRTNRQKPLILRQERSLEAEESATGFVSFPVVHASSKEPNLALTLNIRGKSVQIPLNDAIRRTSDCTVKLIGPDGALAVVKIVRPMDALSVWILEDTLQDLKKQQVKRVVIQYLDAEEGWASSGSTVHTKSVLDWLQSAKNNQGSDRPQIGFLINSPVQFEKLFVVQPATSRRPSYGFQNLMKPSVQAAVAASLREVFQVASADVLEVAFRSPNAGIRQAAMETNIDRMSPESLRRIYETPPKSSEQQKVLAVQLYRSASPVALEILEELARSKSKEVSQAAMKSIIKSASRNAIPAAQRLWDEFAGDPFWETDFVNAILDEKDARFTNVLSAFAEKRLTSLTTDAAPEPSGGRADDRSPSRLQSQQPPLFAMRRNLKTLPLVLSFLQQQNDRRIEEVAVQQLLKIQDVEIQDDVMKFLLQGHIPSLRLLVADYVRQRLLLLESHEEDSSSSGGKSPSARYATPKQVAESSRYSDVLFHAIQKYPRHEYTPDLIKLAEDNSLSSSLREEAFQSALLTSSMSQLDELLTGFPKMKRQQRISTLGQLSERNHPRWLELAESELKTQDASAPKVIGLLTQDRSLDSALVLVRHLDVIRLKSEQLARRGEEIDEKRLQEVNLISDAFISVRHPTVKAAINQLIKSPVLEFHEVGARSQYRQGLAMPGYSLRKQANGLRKNGENAEAEKLLRKVLASDPFDDLSMTSLASLCMRDDRPKEAMELLQRARKVSPDDVETESFIALAMIRLGDAPGGIKLTLSTLEDVPDLPTPLRTNALYNTACAYSRASEEVKNDRVRESHVRKALEYLRYSIHRSNGFYDVPHTLADPDLNVLHKHDEWDNVIDEMKTQAKINGALKF